MPTPRRLIPVLFLLSALFPAIASAQDKGFDPLAGQPAAGPGPDQPLEVRAVPAAEAVAPGGQLPIAVVFEIEPGFHIWPPDEPISAGGFTSIPTRLDAPAQAGLQPGPAQWPEPHPVTVRFTGEPTELPMYEGRNVAYLPLVVPTDAQPGQATLELTFSYQACDDTTCFAPTDVPLQVTLRIEPDAPAAATGGELFDGFDPSVFAAMAAGEVDVAARPAAAESSGRTFFGIAVPRGESLLGLLVLSLLGVAGGFILNLTPCVLPVIPIKIMTISQHAGTPGRALALGLWMALGVVAFWLAIGLPVAFLAGVTDPSMIFGLWWVTLGIGLLIAAMAAGLLGLFQIQLPQRLYMVNPKADNPQGSFLFGVMTAILGLPCFGFVAGALLAGAAALPATTVVIIFASIGVGMALPYLVLSARPQWVEKIPRTGPAGELVKQVMGLLLLAAAAFFIGTGIIALVSRTAGPAPELPWWWKQVHWWFVAIFTLAAGAWLAYRTFRITRRPGRRIAFTALGAVLGLGVAAYAAESTLKARDNFWIPYSPQAFDEAAGRVIVVDFTASWCINCHFLEETVLNRDPVRTQLLSPGVVPLQADLSATSAPGWKTLRELGQTGIPTLAVFGPGLDQPWIANNYTPGMVVEAIGRARGEAADPAAPLEQAAAETTAEDG